MKKLFKILIWISFCIIFVGPVNADVEQNLLSTIKLPHPVKDMDITEDGEKICVLDNQGKISIYNRFGELMHELFVGEEIDRIKVGSEGDELFLYDTTKSVIKIVDLVFIYDIDISGSPYKGPADAAVTVVVFSDFQCPYCARVANFMEDILKLYPKQVKYVFKQYPLASHHFAATAAQASVAAQDQGKFWEFHDLLFKNYNRLNDQIIEEISSTLKLDKTVFEKKMNASKTNEKVRSDKQEGREIGVTGTPAVFVNGKKMDRNSFENIKSAIEAEFLELPK